MKPNNFQVNEAGAHLIAAKLLLLGFPSESFHIYGPRECGVSNRYRVRLLNRAGDKLGLRPRVRRSRTWYEPSDYRAESDDAYPVYIDLAEGGLDFYVVPPQWLEENIRAIHEAYLAENDGHRPRNDMSKHHAVKLEDIEQWRERWDLIAGTPVAAEAIG
jgi:hypothetical protein